MDQTAANAGQHPDPPTNADLPGAIPGTRPGAEHHAGSVTFGRAIAVTAAAGLLLGIIVGPLVSGRSAARGRSFDDPGAHRGCHRRRATSASPRT